MINILLSENRKSAAATGDDARGLARCRAPAHLTEARSRTGAWETDMGVAEQLADRLRRDLGPEHLDIVDFSADHAGHAGARPGGESHFRVTVVAPVFAGRSRLERQRLVLAAAGDLLQGSVHALTVTALDPAEWARRGGAP